jgi:hypothetical protein
MKGGAGSVALIKPVLTLSIPLFPEQRFARMLFKLQQGVSKCPTKRQAADLSHMANHSRQHKPLVGPP